MKEALGARILKTKRSALREKEGPMGFLSNLFGKKDTPSVAPKVQPSCQTEGEKVPASSGPPIGRSFFDSAFRKWMLDLGTFSLEEIDAMLAFVATLPKDAPRNKTLYDNFIKGNPKWGWPDFETMMNGNDRWNPFRKAYKTVKVAEKRALLERLGIAFDKKAKNDELLEIMLEKVTEPVVNSSCPELKQALEEAREKNRLYTFERFMFHVDWYARNLEHLAEIKKLGAQYKFVVHDEKTEERIIAALRKHPKDIPALPPFFPGDMTPISIYLPEFENAKKNKAAVPGTLACIERSH